MTLNASEKAQVKDLMDAQLALGAKFADDILVKNAPLMRAAEEYTIGYRGDFEYMLKLKDQRKALSLGQLRGAANCMLAQYRMKQNNQAQAAVTFLGAVRDVVAAATADLQRPTLHFGEFIVRWNAKYNSADIRSKHKEWSEKWQNEGRVWYGAIDADGTVKFGARCPQTVAAALLKLQTADDIHEAIAELGRMSGECVYCGRELSTPESLAVGYGPVCAKHYGLPWGQVPAPAPVATIDASDLGIKGWPDAFGRFGDVYP